MATFDAFVIKYGMILRELLNNLLPRVLMWLRVDKDLDGRITGEEVKEVRINRFWFSYTQGRPSETFVTFFQLFLKKFTYK